MLMVPGVLRGAFPTLGVFPFKFRRAGIIVEEISKRIEARDLEWAGGESRRAL
jgi:hypothetical protein